MLYSRISNQGGRLSSLHCQFVSVTNLLLLYQHASLSAYKPQRKVMFGTQLYKPMAFDSFSFCFQKRGGEDCDDDLASDTCLVHSQLQVRGGVSPGQYHSTVVARYSPVSYLRNIVSSGCRPAEGPYRPSDLAQTHSGLTGYGPSSANTSSRRSGSPTIDLYFFSIARSVATTSRMGIPTLVWMDRDAVLHITSSTDFRRSS